MHFEEFTHLTRLYVVRVFLLCFDCIDLRDSLHRQEEESACHKLGRWTVSAQQDAESREVTLRTRLAVALARNAALSAQVLNYYYCHYRVNPR